MDAGARGRRLLQRREYRAKVSEFIPKELEDHVVYENPNTNLFSDKTSDRIINTINKASDAFKNNKILNKIGSVFKSKNPGSNYTKDGKVVADSYVPEASSAQEKAMNDAKMKKMEDDKVASKKKGMKEGTKYGMYKGSGKASGAFKDYLDKKKKEKKKKEVSEDMKGMSQKSGDKRSTESGAGMTAKGVAKYNRRTGGNLKTAVTTPPSKLKPGSKAAKRRKSFCARSKSWDGPRGKAARRRWNCSYEPELPMIIDEKKKLFNTAPLSNRVTNWSKKINEGDSYIKSDRNKFGLPKDLKSTEKKADKKTTTGVNYGAMAQSYEPQGEVIQEMPTDIKNVVKGGLSSAKDQFLDTGKVNVKSTLKNTLKNALQTKTVTDFLKQEDYIDERKMTSSEKDKKEKYVKGMKKDKGGFTKRYGKDGKSVMYATATKMAMKEESCGKGEYYCNDDQKCKPIPDGYKEGKDGMLVKEAKYEKGASTYGKASIRNKRAFGKGGNAASPEERGAAIKTRRSKHQERRFVKKGNKYHEPGKHRPDVAGVNKPEDETKYKKNQYAKENALIDKIKNDYNLIKYIKGVVKNRNNQLKQNNDAINSVLPGSASGTGILKTEGSLHKWFKGSKSKDGKPGWVNVVTGGTCASDKKGEGTPKCVSSSKRASMTKAERLSASRRKKKADPGQQSKSGAAKPTYVATDKKKK